MIILNGFNFAVDVEKNLLMMPIIRTMFVRFYVILYSIMDSLTLLEFGNRETPAILIGMIILNGFNFSIDSGKKLINIIMRIIINNIVFSAKCRNNSLKEKYHNK